MKIDAIRKNIFKLSHAAQSAHVGSSLSCVEILVSCFETLAVKNSFIGKIILSKGHAAMALYATAIEYGFLSEAVIEKYLKDGSELWGHPSLNKSFNFIHWSTGSLGHGLPVATGFCYSRKILQKSDEQIFVICSDGELNEGSNWEALMFASHHKLGNLYLFIDYNKIQSFGFCKDVIKLEPLKDKFSSFGAETYVVDGHDILKIKNIIDLGKMSEKPKVIICNTIKGKGLPEYENTVASHYKPITKEILKKYYAE